MSENPAPPENRLRRSLRLSDSVAILVGITIGAGIYSTPQIIAAYGPSFPLVLMLWSVGGLFALTGGLIYAELGTRLPRTGGEYVYIHRAFGPLAGFMFGWSQLLIIRTSAAAGLSIVVANYLQYFLPLSQWQHTAVALGVVFGLGFLNYTGVRPASVFQNASTLLKVAGILLLVSLALILGGGGSARSAGEVTESTGAGRPGRYLVAMCRERFRRLKRRIVVMRLRSRVVPAAVALVVLVTSASCGQAPAPVPAEPSAPANPLHGVWSMSAMTPGGGGATIDPSQPGLFIFTEGHYSAVYSLGADPRPLSAVGFNPTSEEKVAQYDTIIVNTGTYEASGSTITFRPMVAKSPEFIGGHSTMDFQINGDVLTLTVQSVVATDGVSPPDELAESMTLRRIE